MRGSRLLSVALSLFALGACTYAGTPVPLRGSPADIGTLAGSWDGEYWSEESGRRGTLLFTIRSGADTAFGDVVLNSGTPVPVMAADAKDPQHLMHSRAPEVLRMTFVAVQGRMIQGQIEPYIAPDCDCVVVTEFLGTVNGDRVEGTYTTRGERLRQEGRWWMRRRATAE